MLSTIGMGLISAEALVGALVFLDGRLRVRALQLLSGQEACAGYVVRLRPPHGVRVRCVCV